MRRLIIFRHGEAQVRAPSGRDFDRSLTPGGEAAAARTAAALAAAMTTPDVALVSDAARTRQTWAAAAPSFPLSEAVFKHELYNASADAILAQAETRPEATVAVVGHNPGLQTLALDLLRRQAAPPALMARVESRFPTATAAVFVFEDGRPELEALLLGSGPA